MERDHYRPQRNWGARVRDMNWLGLRTHVIENERLRIAVLTGKGADLIELNYKPVDMDFIWLAPGGVRNPLPYAATSPDERAAFRDNYPGGWQEVFPNGGMPSSFDGASHTQHGEVFNVPWDADIIVDTEEEVAVRFMVRTRKTPCLIEKVIRLHRGEAGFRIEQRLINESPASISAMWGHHITFGSPFLLPGSIIRLPEGITVVPHPHDIAPGGRRVSVSDPFPWPITPTGETDLSIVPGRGAPSDMLYLEGFRNGDAWYEVCQPGEQLGIRIEWDARQMPFLWMWQEFGRSTGYPWYGRNYNIGLEPFSSMPNMGLAEAATNGTALTLAPWEERSFHLTMNVITPMGLRPNS